LSICDAESAVNAGVDWVETTIPRSFHSASKLQAPRIAAASGLKSWAIKPAIARQHQTLAGGDNPTLAGRPLGQPDEAMDAEVGEHIRTRALPPPRDRTTTSGPQKVTSTPATTVEALMYALRCGLSCLEDHANRVRLLSCDSAAMKEIIARLRTWKARKVDWLPVWSDADTGKLAKAWRTLKELKV
jgi:hypothetical protein